MSGNIYDQFQARTADRIRAETAWHEYLVQHNPDRTGVLSICHDYFIRGYLAGRGWDDE